MISDLVGNRNEYLFLLYVFSEISTSDCFSEVENAIILNSIRLDTILSDDFETEYYLLSSIISKQWKPGSIDNYLIAVANEMRLINIDRESFDLHSFLIIDIKQNRIIAPYDGGVDIFVNTSQERDYFKSKYKDWLSYTDNGL